LLDRVRRQTRAEVAEGRCRSLKACPPDFHDNPPSDDDGTGFSNHTQVPGHGDVTQGFSSSQEVSDYLPQPYKGAAAWDEMDDIDNDTDADADAEKTADFIEVRGVA
jgi:hypothetical protein